jgi:serine/threonine protein kinase/tetratricopeptide (TPR) repeat protein
MDPLAGTDGGLVAGRFRIEREVGRGAAGIVYRAEDTTTGVGVALKVISAAGADAADQARFEREGQVLSNLDHPGIVRVVAFGALETPCPDGLGRRLEVGSPYIAMEWLEGEDLQARQRRSPLSLRQALDVGRQVALALGAAHDAGVVHRDIKPSNIFLIGGMDNQPKSGIVGAGRDGAEGGPQPRGPEALNGSEPPPRMSLDDSAVHQLRIGPSQIRTKLVDFGVASSSDVRLTKTGAVVGTPAYMAPEQARGDATPDARSDIYSLGATLFELIAGRPPHIGPNSIATLARLVTTSAPRLSDLLLDVPPHLDDLIHSMLSSSPDERPPSAREVAAAIDELLRDPNLPGLARAAEPRVEHTSSGTRLVTTLVALHVAKGDERTWEIDRLREHGADALPIGDDSLVAHLGMQRAYGDEGARALELGLTLAARGARVGVATGRMRVDRMRSAGEVVDQASALAREAGPGGLLADANTADLARGRFQFKMLPRGIAMVVGLGVKRDAGAVAPFVGRDAEFIATLSAYDRSVEDATPVIVTVSGPPGIGKSRLGREFLARLMTRPEGGDGPPGGRPPRLMHTRCESYGKGQALGVAADALRSLLGLPKGASLEQTEAAIFERTQGGASFTMEAPKQVFLGKGPQQDSGLLARLLANQPFPSGTDPRGARDALWLSMTELVLGACAAGPCALMVEDAQWSDPESIAWIDHLLSRASGRPLFALMLMRPPFWRSQGQRFVGRDHVRVELRPIARRATREIARAMIGAGATDAMLDQVAQQAAGSPLFAEELARVVASGKDMGTAPTIEAAIQVSLDALEEATRDAIVRASVFGMSVWDAGLSALGTPDAGSTLRKLVAAELLVESPGSRFAGTREFLFKHALVREVAYATAGEEQKKELHGVAARWLDSMGEDAATVAQHFDLGGRHEEAADHWEIAARRALATNSLREAVSMADRALTFAVDKPVAFARAVVLDEAYTRLDPRASERDSAIRAMSDNVFDEASELKTMGARARYDDACASGTDIEERLNRVRERARALDLVDEEGRCSATLAHRFAFAGSLAQAEREARHLLDLASLRQLVWAAVDAWQALGVVHQTRGELAAALEARRNAARAARAAGLQEREAILTMNVGFALTTIGAWEEALHELTAGLTKAHEIGSAGAVRHGQMNLLCWAATYGSDGRLDAQLVEPRAQADEAASGTWMVRDRATLGVLFYRGLELLRGDAAALPKARALLKTVAEAYRSTENRDVIPVALGFWAEAERRSGDAEQAVEIAAEAARLVEAGAPSLLNEAPIYLALHDAHVDTGDLRGARDAMARGIMPLMRRLKGLEGTPYARSFLLGLPHNSALLAAAEAYGCIPPEIERLLQQTEG